MNGPTGDHDYDAALAALRHTINRTHGVALPRGGTSGIYGGRDTPRDPQAFFDRLNTGASSWSVDALPAYVLADRAIPRFPRLDIGVPWVTIEPSCEDFQSDLARLLNDIPLPANTRPPWTTHLHHDIRFDPFNDRRRADPHHLGPNYYHRHDHTAATIAMAVTCLVIAAAVALAIYVIVTTGRP